MSTNENNGTTEAVESIIGTPYKPINDVMGTTETPGGIVQ